MSYKEGIHSTVTHDGNTYYVDDVINLAKHERIQLIEVKDLFWLLDHGEADPTRVKKADLSVATIGVYYNDNGTKRLSIIDGFHRLTRAVQEKKTYLGVKIIEEKDLLKLRRVSAI